MALSGTAYLDDRLGKLIEAYLVAETDASKLIWNSMAPLGTFSARIMLAHALGLIKAKERDQLNMLRKIRNLFAHDFKISMTDPIVISTMANFREIMDITGSVLDDTFKLTIASTPRERFFHAVLRLAHQLDVRPIVMRDEQLQLEPIDWRLLYL
jgi:hypothetical protein